MDRLQAALATAAAALPVAAVAALAAVVTGQLGVWSATTAALAVAGCGAAVLAAAAIAACWAGRACRKPHKTENRRRSGASNGNAMLDVTSAMPLGTAVTRNGHR